MKVSFKPINASIIHKDKITDEHTVIISTSEKGAKYLLIPHSHYMHGMNSQCETLMFIGRVINFQRLWLDDLDGVKKLKDWIEFCEEKKYSMYVFTTLKEAINELF